MTYISVVDWDRFQHYKDRGPLWIKLYTALLSSDEYLELSLARRGILAGVLLEYARSGCRLSADTRSLSRKLAGRVTVQDLEALNHAGFIEVVASKALANGYQPASAHASREETERETEVLSQGRAVVRPLVHDPDSDLDERDEEHKDDESFAIGPEPELPRNGATADQHGPQPLEPDQLLERWKTA